jgi:hypothetical protein
MFASSYQHSFCCRRYIYFFWREARVFPPVGSGLPPFFVSPKIIWCKE